MPTLMGGSSSWLTPGMTAGEEEATFGCDGTAVAATGLDKSVG